MIVCVYIQYKLPRRSNPFGRYCDELEHKCFDATCCFESELFHFKPLHDEFVEVAYKCCEKKEYSVFCHKGFGQSVPPETIVHVIEDSFLSSICFTLPLINKDRVQFELNAIDFLSFPTSESKDVIVEQTAAVSTDIIVSIAVCCGGGRPPLRFLFLISDCEFLQRIERTVEDVEVDVALNAR